MSDLLPHPGGPSYSPLSAHPWLHRVTSRLGVSMDWCKDESKAPAGGNATVLGLIPFTGEVWLV